MLAPVKERLMREKIYLATESRPRKQVLEQMGLADIFICKGSGADEVLDSTEYKSNEEYVKKIAEQKMYALKKILADEGKDWDVIIAADTIVVDADGYILCKPKDVEEGKNHLRRLSGRRNDVVTAVAMIMKNLKRETFIEKTSVYFAELTENQITEYAATPESRNCAGGYAIQGGAGTFVTRICGNYHSILGLPIHQICTRLYKMIMTPK